MSESLSKLLADEVVNPPGEMPSTSAALSAAYREVEDRFVLLSPTLGQRYCEVCDHLAPDHEEGCVVAAVLAILRGEGAKPATALDTERLARALRPWERTDSMDLPTVQCDLTATEWAVLLAAGYASDERKP